MKGAQRNALRMLRKRLVLTLAFEWLASLAAGCTRRCGANRTEVNELMDDLIPKVFDTSITIGTVPGPGAMIATREFIVRLGNRHLGKRRSQHHRNADSADHRASLRSVRPGGGFTDLWPQSARVPA